ncbi:GDP-mannose 4,6-dehydratase [Nonomuraea antri]|uniref:GDP-mannose 4,6-dehydratase n=1 Tax=Nonomuraea antri TaxID=2730852 RepID=UPI002E2E4990|nr:NAD-dependent epimerase/dehydratase family protein [Nonomuraea antri]
MVCVDNFSTGTPSNIAALTSHTGFAVVESDVTEPLMISGQVDLLLHFACPASPADFLRHPIDTLKAGSLGTLHALDLACRTQAHFVLASTSEVYGDPQQHPQRESYWGNVNPIGPRSAYDEAKRFSEALTTAYRTSCGLKTAIVRLFNIYGPRMRADDGRVIPTFIQQALTHIPLTVAGDGSQTRSFCYIDDAVRGILALAASDHSGPVNIGNPTEITISTLAQLIKREARSPSPVHLIDRPQDDPQQRCPDISAARELLGWEPTVDLEEGIRETIRHQTRRHSLSSR